MFRSMIVLPRMVAVALLSAVPIAGVARADDVFPPPYRGTPLGVEGHWHAGDGPTFSPNNVHIYNRVPPSPGESFSTVPATLLNPGAGPIYELTFPDWIDDQPLKLGRIQLYWISTDPTAHPVMDGIAFPGTGIRGIDGVTTVPGVVVGQGVIPFAIPGYYFDFQIRPNPDYEFLDWVFVSGNGAPTTVQLQQVDIDTVSIPEPAAVTMLGTIGLLALRRRRPAA